MTSAPARRRFVVFGFLAGLVGVSAAIYGAVWWVSDGVARSPLQLVLAPEAAAHMGGFAEVVVAVLGVAITVVAILVELAANRYTPRIADLFVRDKVNVTVLGGLVVAAVLVVWLDITGWPDAAAAMRVASLVIISISLLVLLPYFAYVFDFLDPLRVVRRLRDRASGAIRRGALPARAKSSRDDLLHQLDQLGDMAAHALDNRDKTIAMVAVNAIADVMEGYLQAKSGLPEAWFAVGRSIRRDQDFVATHPDLIGAIEARRTWAEMKALRQLQGVFASSLRDSREVAHLIAIRTRHLAKWARRSGDEHALTLILRFLNTFQREAINAEDVRSAYNLYNELRLVGEDLLRHGEDQRLVELSQRMKFYGQLAFERHLPFLLETAAYDLGALLVQASLADHPRHDELLAILLDVDRPPDTKTQVESLRGVRKAQIKLATHYLARGDRGRARRIQEDMRREPRERLRSLRSEMTAVTDPEYWEVSDRGIHFDYIPAERREYLKAFFAWFEQGAA